MDFASAKVVYHWAEATLPPPDHYEIEIQLFPSGGSIKYWPDYSGEGIPSWESWFKLNDHDWDPLVHLILPLLDTRWITHSPPHLGSATEWLEINVGVDDIEIPPDLIQEQAVRVSLLYSQIRGLVPPNIWEDFTLRHRTYRQSIGY